MSRNYLATAVLNVTTTSADRKSKSRYNPSAVLHLDAQRVGPLAHLGAVQSARPLRPPPGWPPCTAPGPPCRTHIARQCFPQRPGMPGVQVDLIAGAVQSEADTDPDRHPQRSR